MPPNPFTALTLIAAPAVLTNATALLIYTTSNRYNFVTERFKTIAADLAAPDITARVREVRLRQIERTEARAHLLLGSLRAFYAALSLFAASALTALLGAALATTQVRFGLLLAEYLALPLGAVAVGGQIVGCVLLLREANLAILNVSENALILREKYGDLL